MYPEQSNTKEGAIVLPANVDLTGKEGYLVMIVNDGGVAKAGLLTAATDAALYVVLESAEADADCTILPLTPGRNVRVVAKSTTLVPGDKVIGYASGSEGMLTEYASGEAFIVGICEEVGDTEDQLVLIRPVLSYLNND
jgi:hypothetical protein